MQECSIDDEYDTLEVPDINGLLQFAKTDKLSDTPESNQPSASMLRQAQLDKRQFGSHTSQAAQDVSHNTQKLTTEYPQSKRQPRTASSLISSYFIKNPNNKNPLVRNDHNLFAKNCKSNQSQTNKMDIDDKVTNTKNAGFSNGLPTLVDLGVVYFSNRIWN